MRQDRYREKGQRHRKKRGKGKKIILAVLIFLLTAVVAAEVAVLLSMTTVDRTFTRDVVRGVHDGWALDRNELELVTEGRITDTGFIDAELDAVRDYRNKPFEDDQLGEYAKQYIAALRACSKAAKNNDPKEDFDAFWAEFAQPYGQRLEALYSMYMGDYNMELYKEGAEEELNNLMLQGWALKKIENLKFREAGSGGGRSRYRAALRNDSEFDLTYLELRIEIYNSKGKLIETSYAFARDIKNGDSAELTFYHVGSKADSYRIASVICEGVYSVQDEEE